MSKTTVLLFTLIVCAFLCASGCNSSPTTLTDGYLCEGCGKKHPNYDPDFCDHTVLVVMTKEASAPNKIHDPEFFGDIGLVNIRDLFMISDEALEWTDVDNFQQILLLTLNKNCKVNVLNATLYLGIIEGIEFAEPRYYWSECASES